MRLVTAVLIVLLALIQYPLWWGHGGWLRVHELQGELAQHVTLQRAEAAAECNVLVGRDALVAKHQHVVVEVRAVDAGEVVIGKRLGQIEADHFGAERRVERNDIEVLLKPGGWIRRLRGKSGSGHGRGSVERKP